MIIQLRPYQQAAVDETYQAWRNGNQNVCLVMPTGSGKAFTLSFVAKEYASRQEKVIIQVHRKELLGQLSCSLAAIGVMHTFIAPKKTINFICRLHREKFQGRCYYSTTAKVCLATVQTLVRRNTTSWESLVKLKICDEFHHLQKGNIWGKAWEKFENANGLGPTATPQRTDGGGLSRETDGFADYMVLGPTMRQLIDLGALSKYRVFAPRTDIRDELLKTDIRDEFTAQSVEEALLGSHIVSNAVREYQRVMLNEQAIVFGRSVQNAEELANEFNAAGISALALSSNDDDEKRERGMRDFVNGKLRILTNYALFDEGVDVPGLTGVIDCQPTKSLIKFHQKWGRMLRTAPGKQYGIYIDMVHNLRIGDIGNHALPDSPQLWSLDRTKTRSKEEQDDIVKLTNCLNCWSPYAADLHACPYCGTVPPAPTPRGLSAGPVLIDDDLVELTPETLANLRGEIDSARQDSTEAMHEKFGAAASGIIPMKWRKDHRKRKEELQELDRIISLWAGMWHEFGMTDADIHEEFRKAYRMSIFQARALKRAEAEKLREKITVALVDNGVIVTE